MNQLPLELVRPRYCRPGPFTEEACGVDNYVCFLVYNLTAMAMLDLQTPLANFVVPDGGYVFRLEYNGVLKLVIIRRILDVFPYLWTRDIELAPRRIRLKGEREDVRGNIACNSGVLVDLPRSSDVIAFLIDI